MTPCLSPRDAAVAFVPSLRFHLGIVQRGRRALTVHSPAGHTSIARTKRLITKRWAKNGNAGNVSLRFLVYAITPLVAVFADLSSKRVVEGMLREGKSIHVIGDFLQFTLVHNYGTTFGLFGASAPFRAILLVKGVFILALFGCFLGAGKFIRGARLQLPSRICLLAMMGGSWGNFIDRMADRRVTDFIDIGIQTLRWPVFNVGDAFQVVGGLAVLAIIALQYEQTERQKRAGR